MKEIKEQLLSPLKSFMVIGINCLALEADYVGGIATYAKGLIEGFLTTDSKHRILIFVTKENRVIFKQFESHPDVEFHEMVFPNSVLDKLIKNALLLIGSISLYRFFINLFYGSISKEISSKVNCVYFPTTLIFPFNYSVPTIASMHDIQHVHFPEFFTLRERLFRYYNFFLSAKFSTFLQASSEFIEQDLLKHFSFLKPEKIWVIPEGVSIQEFQTIDSSIDIFQKYHIPQKFVFFPAQLWKHKNHITVLKALHLIEKENGIKVPLILTGAKYSAAEEIFSFIKKNYMDQVQYLGKVPFNDLVALYQNSSIFITAVLYESSSLPLREAAAAGAALMASEIGPNIEAARILKVNLFNANNPHDLKNKFLEVWNDPSLRQEQIDFNKNAIHHYSWKSVAGLYLEKIEKCI